MPLQKPFLEALSAFAEVMRAEGGRWYLFGAQAVLFWGRARFSEDLDVTAEINIDQPDGFVVKMREAGFRLRADDWRQVLRTTRVLPFVYLPNGILLDLVVAGPGLEEDFLARATEVEVDGHRVSVITPEDLIAGKLFAGRAKDLEDAYGILRERGQSLDLELLRETVTSLDTFLGTDLQVRLDRLLERVGSAEAE